MNTYLKPQLEKAIKDLENIEQKYIPKFFYNVNFKISDGNIVFYRNLKKNIHNFIKLIYILNHY